MNWKNREYPQQKIREVLGDKLQKADMGKVEWMTGLFCFLLLSVLLCMQLEIFLYQTAGVYLEDALAASNLASAVINVEEYGISHRVLIEDGYRAYEIYRKAMEGNLKLDANWESRDSAIIAGQVTVVNYTIYNVSNGKVKAWGIGEDGSTYTMQGSLGSVYAPNGKQIENTSVYSEISFPVRGLFGICVQAQKGKLVDIVSTQSEIVSEEERIEGEEGYEAREEKYNCRR